MSRGKYFEMFADKVQPPLAGGSHPQLVNSVCSRGVLLVSSLLLSYHIATAANHVFSHLGDSIPSQQSADEVLDSVIHGFITSLLDYSHVIHLDMKPSTIRKLQLVQNTAAHLIRNTGYCEHITPGLYTGFPNNFESSPRSQSISSKHSMAWAQDT